MDISVADVFKKYEQNDEEREDDEDEIMFNSSNEVETKEESLKIIISE